MNKKTIKLTESELHRIIKESVQKLTNLSYLEDNYQQLYNVKFSVKEISDNVHHLYSHSQGKDREEWSETLKSLDYIEDIIDRIIELNLNALSVEKNNGNEYKEVKNVCAYSDFILVANNTGYNFLNTETNELLLPKPLSTKKTEIFGLRSASLQKYVPSWTINGKSYCVRDNNEIYEFNPYAIKNGYKKILNYNNY